MSDCRSPAPPGARTLPEILALAFGAIYLLVGIVGFFITGFDDFFGHTDETLLVLRRSTRRTTSSTS